MNDPIFYPAHSFRAQRAPLVAGLVLAAMAAGAGAFAADLPAAISADGKVELLKLHAEGVQIYECKVDPAGGSKWQFREPLATLLKDGKTVGRHFAGPSWELASGGAVVGKVDAQAPGATSNDIALLRLNVAGKWGKGELDKVTTVLRLDTKGGVFSGSCNMPGMLHLEPYGADYVFLGN
ncbi:DUF3455 domain-containing protein [Rhizobium sp. 2YAF20]|uniref:DUF3455 domain-containing protein n=1 Tax=Rhizobium sp. 2YAF20 TaxID=3233027 RepID=UPI003F944848